MDTTAKIRPFSRRPPPDERLSLLLALDEAGQRRDDALKAFDRISDPALITSAVHRLEAAAAEYGALLREAKQLGIRRTFAEAEAMKKEHPDPGKVL